jgi:hypothetical protein
MTWKTFFYLLGIALTAFATTTDANTAPIQRPTERESTPSLTGDLMQWHPITLVFRGPDTSEQSTPNPFTDYRLDVKFQQGEHVLNVPGFYAADGNAADTGADKGNCWHVHFAAPATGTWEWSASFRKGPRVASSTTVHAGVSAGFFDKASGSFEIRESDKRAPDLRARGRLSYVGNRYPVTLGDNQPFIKTGVDSPENLLAYEDFDGDFKHDDVKDHLIKSWNPHVQDWRNGDPEWGGGRGRGLIGAINYLASRGMNSISFLTMNIGGDDDNVFPYCNRLAHDRFDVSRLAQWDIVFSHATTKGLFLHFKTQETENETLLDDGDTQHARRLYYRELIARFAHHPALNWNLGEENGEWGKHAKKRYQTTEQRLKMGRFFAENDPYSHPIVIHNGQWFTDLYGPSSPYCGASLQTNTDTFKNVHHATLRILRESEQAGRPWMVSCDEPGDAQHALVPDAEDPGHDHARRAALWGNLLAGGWGVEWYFGYKHSHSDLTCEDFRSRDRMWRQCAIAQMFFKKHFRLTSDLKPADHLVAHGNHYCLAKPGSRYLVFLTSTATGATLDLEDHCNTYSVRWFNPRQGGDMTGGSVAEVTGPGHQKLGIPLEHDHKDWVVVVEQHSENAGPDKPAFTSP